MQILKIKKFVSKRKIVPMKDKNESTLDYSYNWPTNFDLKEKETINRFLSIPL